MSSKDVSTGDFLAVIAAALGVTVVLVFIPVALIVVLPLAALYFGYKIVLAIYNSDGLAERRAKRHTQQLYEAALAARAGVPDKMAWGKALYEQFPKLPDELDGELLSVALAIYDWEQFELQPPPPVCNSIEGARYRDVLAKPPNTQQALATFARVARNIAARVPKETGKDAITLSVPFRDIADGELIEGVIMPFYGEQNIGVFDALRNQFDRNQYEASGVPYTLDYKDSHRLVMPSDYKDDDLIDAYLKDTPFRDVFNAPVPFGIPFDARFSHVHVIGGSGAGKTQLLQNIILHDLESADPPSLVIVDSQGDLIRKLSSLALFEPEHGRLKDRLIIITPKDTDYPPAVNIFDLNKERLGRYSGAVREQVTAGVIDTFMYLFHGLLGADLTAKQAVFFKFVARLMLSMPETMGRNATILDMLNLMDNAAPYSKAIASLPDIPRQFFERDFPSKTFVQTKEQIRYRLNAILENPTLARLFTAQHTRIDLFTELNRGSIILIDTAKDFLKSGSSHFGRIFISLVLQAVLERAAVPENKRTPAFLIVDEAAEYFDTNIDDLLTETRKYRLGCLFSHQFLDQATSSLRASLAANTAIKLVGSVSTQDARALAPDLRTTADFILSQKPFHFACFVRGVTEHAVSIPVKLGKLEKQERLSVSAHDALLASNRARVSTQTGDKEVLAQAPVSSAPEVDDAAPATGW